MNELMIERIGKREYMLAKDEWLDEWMSEDSLGE
jgi:hypothetical protein